MNEENQDFLREEQNFTVTMFIEGGLNLPFNMTENEVRKVFGYLSRPKWLRPRGFVMHTNDGQTRLKIDLTKVILIEANDAEYLKALNIHRQRAQQEAAASTQQ